MSSETMAGNQPDFELPGDLGPKDPRRMEHPVGNIPGAGGHEVKPGSAEAEGHAMGEGNAAPDERRGDTNAEEHHTSEAMDPSVDASTSENVESRQERRLMGDDMDQDRGSRQQQSGYSTEQRSEGYGQQGSGSEQQRYTENYSSSTGRDIGRETETVGAGYGSQETGSTGWHTGSTAEFGGVGGRGIGGMEPHHDLDGQSFNAGRAPGEHNTLAGQLLDPETSGGASLSSVYGNTAEYGGTAATGSHHHHHHGHHHGQEGVSQSGLSGSEYGTTGGMSSGLGGSGAGMGSTGSGYGSTGGMGSGLDRSGATGSEFGSTGGMGSEFGSSGATGSGYGSTGGVGSGLGSSGATGSGYGSTGGIGSEFGSSGNSGYGNTGSGEKSYTQSAMDTVTGNNSSQSGREPLSGVTGSGRGGESYDAGNSSSTYTGETGNEGKSWTQSVMDTVTGNNSSTGTGNTGSRSQY